MLEKSELSKKYKNQVIDLEKLRKVKRIVFWKPVKNQKRKNGKKILNDKLDFERFSLFYSKLFMNDLYDTEEHMRNSR